VPFVIEVKYLDSATRCTFGHSASHSEGRHGAIELLQ